MNVLIVGATSGIGRAIAHMFAKNDHRVICGGRDRQELGYMVCDLNIRYGNNATSVPINLLQLESVKLCVERVYESQVKIDCLILTAGTMPSDQDEYFDEKALCDTTMINYVGAAALINQISRRMMKERNGLIICLSSVAGERGRQSNFIYGASKSALSTYLQGLRMKLNDYNVRVVTVLPGYIDTLMSYGKIDRRLAVSPDYAAKKIYKLITLNRNIVYIPFVWRAVMTVIKLIPEFIFKRLSF